MNKLNLLMIVRGFKRSRSTFMINLAGLSTGVACTLLIYLWVQNELGVNRHFKDAGRIYQVMEQVHNTNKTITQEYTPDLLASTISKEMPEIERATAVLPVSQVPWNFSVSTQDVKPRVFKIKGQFADSNFFRVFSYPLLAGSAASALKTKESVAVSETMALKLFGTVQDAIGKPLNWSLSNFRGVVTIAAVFKDLPNTVAEQFDICFTHELFMSPQVFDRTINWDNQAPSTYLVMKKGVNIQLFNKKIEDYLKTKLPSIKTTLFVRPFTDAYLYNNYEEGALTGGRIEYVRLFSIIGVFILLIACINFINLTTAKASIRLKEIGVKKTLGADRKALVLQYLAESLLLSFFAYLLALLIMFLFLPVFNQITGKQLSLHPGIQFIIGSAAVILITGFLSGLYPALYLSGFKPVAIFKGKLQFSAGEVFARKGLVVFQFFLSAVFIFGVLVLYQQIRYVQHRNLGYDKDQVLYFTVDGPLSDNKDAFIAELKKIKGVKNAGSVVQSFLVPGQGHTTGLDWTGKNPNTSIRFTNIGLGYGAIEAMGLQITDGRAYAAAYPTDSNGMIFNETAIKAMDLHQPVGKTVQLWGQPRTIVGVVKDFHYASLHDKIEPAFLKIENKEANTIMVGIMSGREPATLEQIKKLYSSFNQGYTFDYRFLDDDFQAQYQNEQRIAVLSRYMAGLAVLISCLGLFALSAFTAERRKKEIGVRKVLGATEPGIIGLLSKDFLGLVLIAVIIALPVAWLAAQRWLGTFYYKIKLNPLLFAGVALLVLLIAFIAISGQCIRAATANPVKALRSE